MSIPIMADGLPQANLDLLGDEYEVFDWDISDGSPALEKCVALLTYSHPGVDGALMDRMPNLKVISNHGVGVDHIVVADADARGIPVGNTPGCLNASTADMTMALLMASARNVVVGDHYARSPEFVHYDPAILIGQEVTGSTLGIVGMGRIGKEVAKRANAFDMKVLYHNRRRDEAAEQSLGVEYRELNDLLQECDFVTLNCPLTPETTGMIGREQLELMQPGATLINMARGPVVVTQDLYDVLKVGRIRGAGLDVTDPEPLERDNPLLTLTNVVIAPHLGSASNRTRQRMMEMSIENMAAGLAGNALPYQVGGK
jgi:glyoxylate reductase